MRKCISWSIIRKDDVFHHQYVIMWIQVGKSLQYMNDVLRYKSSFKIFIRDVILLHMWLIIAILMYMYENVSFLMCKNYL